MAAEVDCSDARVRRALSLVPRHLFLDERWREQAYADTPLPVGPEATISAPHMVALQLEWALLSPGLKVLEVGSGCGYLLALLDLLVVPGGKVRGVEFERELAERSERTLRSIAPGREVRVRIGDGEEGWPQEGPFDRIVVSYAVRGALPAALAHQLVEGGYLIVPWGEGELTYLERLCRRGEGLRRDLRGPPCLFVPSKSRQGRPPSSDQPQKYHNLKYH
ncbi:MAG: protein-L-isoaspartate O-methyltransferase [Euryarchaeota archaeon]|nr:protein-L-isoaspartate O-methyltransferase [Euryarchaeota archaeon]MDE2046394.1 protein-L-isoaspartate O-methyltransferase [Thermoplasmata archaeon]